jgi:hypothetical protein
LNGNVQRISASILTNSKFLVVIDHHSEVMFPSVASNVTFTTMCDAGLVHEETYRCPYDFNITHHCNGSASMLSSICPGRKYVPACQSLLVDNSSCVVQSYTNFNTTCLCSTHNDANRRLTLQQSDIGYLEIAAMSREVGEAFLGTMYESRDLSNVSALGKVVIVVILFASMWSSGILLTWYYAANALPNRKVEINSEIKIQRERAVAEQDNSVERIKKYLNTYIEEVFPVVFRVQPWHQRLILEVKKHQRHASVF